MRIYAFERPYRPLIFRPGSVLQEVYACELLAVAEQYFEATAVAGDEFVFFGEDGTVITASVTADQRVVLDPALAEDPVALAELLIEQQRARRWPRW
jgi:hypothetical protein